jgi:hypothetical protein
MTRMILLLCASNDPALGGCAGWLRKGVDTSLELAAIVKTGPDGSSTASCDDGVFNFKCIINERFGDDYHERYALTVVLEAYLGRRNAARVLAGPLRRRVGETIRAAMLGVDLRGVTALSDAAPQAAAIAALDAWFDRIAGAVHAFGGEMLKFLGDGMLANFPVAGSSRGPRSARPRPARAGMSHLDAPRRQQNLPRLPFGAAVASRRNSMG